MPRQKDLKRLVRTRMQRTGESYTSARAQLVRKKRSGAARAPNDLAARAGMSDAAIQAKTGRTWREWVQVLDVAGAATWPHRNIARHVHTVCGVPGWWAQSVTVGYERIKGLRDIGQRRDGSYEANKSRTFDVPVKTLFAACKSAAARKRWLAEPDVKLKSATLPRSVRLLWPDHSVTLLWFTAKGPRKSSVAVQHGKLPDRASVERMKRYWGEKLSRLGEELPG
jgi:hypothetical protein